MKQLYVFLLAAALALTSVGCAKKAKAPVPGAINNFDATSYRVLSDAQASIHRAKTQYYCTQQQWPVTVTVDGKQEACSQSNGVYPSSDNGLLHNAILAYNTAEPLYQAYHSGATQDTTALSKALADLTVQVNNLISALGGAK